MSVRFYPVQDCGISCEAYDVRVNGVPVRLDAARVSAFPYNRRWPGHQRTADQTECVNFLTMAADEPLRFEITPKEPFECVAVRPRSLGIDPEITPDGRILFTLPHEAYFTVEPYGRHNALHVFVDPAAGPGADVSDPRVRYFGPGVHEPGLIELHSGQTLYLDEGAVVYACVSAVDAENVRILGRGILDNSRNREEILYEAGAENNDEAVRNAVRRHTVQLEYCTNAEIDGVTIRDSLVYNVRPIGCRGLTVRNVKIIGCWRYNSDGIDMHNCEDVLIENCFLRTFDDAICVKGFDCYYEGDVEAAVRAAMYRNGKAYDVFRNVLVRNCVIWNDWGKSLEIGAETRAEEITDVVFEDCDVIHVCGAPLDCCNVDYADVHRVTWRRIRVEMDEVIPPPRLQRRDGEPYGEAAPGYAPPVISVEVLFHHEYSAGGTRRGKDRDLLFEDLSLIGGVRPRFVFSGYGEDAGCRDIVIRNVTRNGIPLTDPAEYDLAVGEHCGGIRIEP